MNNCTCCRFPRSFEMIAGFKPEIKDPHELYEFVENLMEAEFKLIKQSLSQFTGYWWNKKNPIESTINWFQNGDVYQCLKCSQNWALILNESGLSFFLHALGDSDYLEGKVPQQQWECFKDYQNLETQDPIAAGNKLEKIKSE